MASSSTQPVIRRVLKELSNYKSDPNPCLVSLGPVSEDDLLHWNAVLKGVDGTPYEGGQWRIDIKIPDTYPQEPPNMTFLTAICHPNVHLKVCHGLDIVFFFSFLWMGGDFIRAHIYPS